MMTDFVGRAIDGLSLEERLEIAGRWVAMELYTPATLPLRQIAAIGDSAKACIASLQARGLDPKRFEYLPMRAPY